jgi:hypothetical protein
MNKLDSRTLANLDVALEETCRALPNGGDHEVRSFVAAKLLAAAHDGEITLKELTGVGRAALAQAMQETRKRTS